MIGRRASYALIALTLAGCSPGVTPAESTPPSTSQPALVSTQCADLIVLGARGSDQSATKNRGVGTEVLASVTAMVKQLHQRSKSTVRVVGVPYPAASGPAYTANVFTGVDHARKLLASLAMKCPESRFGLVGFSQGAQIVHGTAIELSSAQVRRVVLVAMISDPRRNPEDKITHWSYGDSTPGPGKLGAGTPIPKGLRSASISFCAQSDEICNWPPRGYSGPLSQTHRHFYETHAAETGKQLASRLASSGF